MTAIICGMSLNEIFLLSMLINMFVLWMQRYFSFQVEVWGNLWVYTNTRNATRLIVSE